MLAAANPLSFRVVEKGIQGVDSPISTDRSIDVPQSLLQRFQSMFQSLTPGGFRRVLGPSWEGLGGAGVPEYSTTNIQVEGVDEADVVKTDGRYIYVVSGSAVYILYAYRSIESRNIFLPIFD